LTYIKEIGPVCNSERMAKLKDFESLYPSTR